MAKKRTDWKSVADELYMVVVGMAAASAHLTGRSVEDALARMQKVRDDSIKANTRG